MDRQWNCRCAPIKRERVFLSQAGSISKRLPHSDYCRGHANRSTIHCANGCVLGPARPSARGTFRNRAPNLESSGNHSHNTINIVPRRSALTVARRKLRQQKSVLQCEAEFGRGRLRPRLSHAGISDAAPIRDACQPGQVVNQL
jgi:hypothetical protein